MVIKKLAVLCVTSLMLVACGNSNETQTSSVDSQNEKESAIVEEGKTSTTTKPAEERKTSITFVDFDKKYARDTESETYIDGLFMFKDGSRANADYIHYIGNGAFDYASAIFYKGKLVNLRVDTTKSIEEVEKELGVTFDENVIVEPIRPGFRIIYDEKFDIDNISRLPNEWD